jgi:hypothetical protein
MSTTWGPTLIAADGDDAGQSTTTFYLSGADTDGNWVVYDNANLNYTIGMRWDNVTVPAGATIVSAVVSLFTKYSTGTGWPKEAFWYCEDQDDPAAFTAAEDGPRTRTKTTAYESQVWASAPTDETWFDSPNLKSVLQEVINRPGWATGQALIFILMENDANENANARFEVQDRKNDATKCAKLTIEYTTGGGGGGGVPSIAMYYSQMMDI